MNRQRLDSPLVYVGAHNVYYVKLTVKVLYFTIHIHTQINQYVVISEFIKSNKLLVVYLNGLLCSLLYQAFNVTEALAFAVLKRSLAYRRAVKKVIMPAQGPQQNVDSLFRVAKCINQQRKSRRMLLTAGIVKVISGKSWTPLL